MLPPSAVDRLIGEIAPRLYRYGLVRLGRVDLADDAVAETLCRLVARGPSLQGHIDRAHVQGWCVRCIVNVCREIERRRRDVPLESSNAAPSYSIEDWRAQVPDVARTLVAATARLSDRQREAVTLRVLMGLPVHAAAEAMSCAEGTVKALTHQGLAALRADLEKQHIRTRHA